MIIEERLLPDGAPSLFSYVDEDALDMALITEDSPVLPCDLVPSVSAALPMTIGELCDANEGLHDLIAARNAMMSTIYDIEEWD